MQLHLVAATGELVGTFMFLLSGYTAQLMVIKVLLRLLWWAVQAGFSRALLGAGYFRFVKMRRYGEANAGQDEIRDDNDHVHQAKYSKPPSVAPPSLSISSSSRTNSENHDRSVNDILADLRRSSIKNNCGPGTVLTHNAPSVPPELRQIFQIPEIPAPAPRRPAQRRIINGRRAPPGPPPPRSWISLSQSRHAPPDFQTRVAGRIQHHPLPGAYYPDERSLVAVALQCIAKDLGQQRDWNRFYLYSLPSRIRSALLAYVSELYESGVSAGDLRLVLAGPPEEELLEYGLGRVDHGKWNADIYHLDLTGSLGKSLSLKELGDLLYPPAVAQESGVLESWDSADAFLESPKLLPNLTHLSLAVDPVSSPSVSWKQLLSFATKVPTLTHLNLSGWPEPSLTPNAKFAKVTSSTTGQSVQYGGTGPYSHSLDNDWSEAAILLRKLSKALYRLEYLDLTGCADWFPALKGGESGTTTSNSLDWVGDWGTITTLRLCSAYALPEGATVGQISRFAEWIGVATEVEKYIRAQRSGKGRFITVEKDTLSEAENLALEREWQQAR
ncbi:hypothetical protein DL762_008849 [Monosporascus cannonballus]|uniref:Tafazzin n=1 Tax=Monosporascus cannonballus TaxID=155416 RepID=A0ABY0GVW2_9PEZI|nr:hypothetical protein DL762_008849 [Monosporascus cannonballus]